VIQQQQQQQPLLLLLILQPQPAGLVMRWGGWPSPMSTVIMIGQPRGTSIVRFTAPFTGTSQSATATSTSVKLSPTWMTVTGMRNLLTPLDMFAFTWYIPYLNDKPQQSHDSTTTKSLVFFSGFKLSLKSLATTLGQLRADLQCAQANSASFPTRNVIWEVAYEQWRALG